MALKEWTKLVSCTECWERFIIDIDKIQEPCPDCGK